ncbi:fructose-6-phosphate aldolase [Candidatus Dojkabacteria bacterium]|nr:fructose-6-phosphate aldolase [Candidatus Dojkabacteria bacterium]
MKIFLDTADIVEVRKAFETGVIDGVTTNPSLAAKSTTSYKESVKQIIELVKGPVSLEVISTDYEGMVEEGKKLMDYGENVIVKLPMGKEAVRATQTLAQSNIKVNMTLIFSATQALLAAKAGAYIVSPFVGRIHDISAEGLDLISDIREIYDNYDFETQILAASFRTAFHIKEVARIGADIATIAPDIFWKLFDHPMTELGLKKFLEDFEKAGVERLV